MLPDCPPGVGFISLGKLPFNTLSEEYSQRFPHYEYFICVINRLFPKQGHQTQK